MDSKTALAVPAANRFLSLKQQAQTGKKLSKGAAKKTQEEFEQFQHHQQRKKKSADLFAYDRFLLFNFNINSYGEWDIVAGIIFAFDDLKLLEFYKIKRDFLLR